MSDPLMINIDSAPTYEEVIKARGKDETEVKKTKPRELKGYSVA